MTKTRPTSSTLSLALAPIALLLAVACAPETSTDASGGQMGEEQDNVTERASESPLSLISFARLSTTHQLELIENEVGDISFIVEKFDPEFNSTALGGLGDTPASEVYWRILQERGVEARDPTGLPVRAETTITNSYSIQNSGQFVCNEPAEWTAITWAFDAAWFIGNFCPDDWGYCSSLNDDHEYTKKAKNISSWGYAQSHCATALYRVGYRYSCGFMGTAVCGGNVMLGDVPPRYLWSAHGSASSKVRWTAEISSNVRNHFTGLSVKTWN